jgi:UDP-N-acetylmuramate dehydrogenase
MQGLLFAKHRDLAVRIIASGSNVVLPEKITGLVINPAMQSIVREGNRLRVAAGVLWDHLVRESIYTSGLFGLENLSGIPGTVGAAPIQNIGAYGIELADRFKSLSAIDLRTHEQHRFDIRTCQFGYRSSIFKKALAGQFIITEIELSLLSQPVPCLDYGELEQQVGTQELHDYPRVIRKSVLQLRQQKLPDPHYRPNVGSFFKNPVISVAEYDALAAELGPIPGHSQGDTCKISAAWLIDHLGFKGHRVGGAQVSSQHALVLENRGGASFADILALTRTVQAAVQENYHLSLEPEPVFFNSTT